jgi:conjugal transfer pilus assembly protein TraU
MKILKLCIALFLCFSHAFGDMINPITDICWECIFPITLSGINVTPNTKDFTKYNTPICICANTPQKVGIPTKIGIPLTFFEPARMVDVTRHPYKLVGLGGIQLGKQKLKNHGSISYIDETQSHTSFHHVHYYVYPILALFGLLTDFQCVEKGELDVAYMSEFDPLWSDESLQNIFNPEAALFSNPLAQLACIADCTLASMNKPDDKLFWCAGCQGSLYPFVGHVSHHTSLLQSSSLIVHRCLAKLHRTGVILGYNEDDFCESRPMPVIKKTLYKTQIVRPKPQTSGECHALGKSDQLWGLGKTYPYKGEDDFVYLLWIKKQCCLDAVQPTVLSY